MENQGFNPNQQQQKPDFELYKQAHLAAQEGATSFTLSPEQDTDVNRHLIQDAFREVSGRSAELVIASPPETPSEKTPARKPKLKLDLEISVKRSKQGGSMALPLIVAAGCMVFIANTSHKKTDTPEPPAPACELTTQLPAADKIDRRPNGDIHITGSTPAVRANGFDIFIDPGVEVGIVQVCGDEASLSIDGLVATAQVWGYKAELAIGKGGIVRQAEVKGPNCVYRGRELPTVKSDGCDERPQPWG